MPRRSTVVAASVLLAAISVLACSATTAPISDDCDVRLAEITPDPADVAVNDTLTVHARLIGPAACLPSDTAAADLRWAVAPGSDTSLAHIDSLTGLVRGQHVGEVQVLLLTSRSRTDLAFGTVTITP